VLAKVVDVAHHEPHRVSDFPKAFPDLF